MRISALALDGNRGRPDLELDPIEPGLNVLFGPAGSGKTALADLLTHALYGREPTAASHGERALLPEGQVTVDSGSGRYRLRRYQNGTSAGRLTIASLDGSRVDPAAVRQMLHGISPALAARLYAVSFREPPQVESLLSAEFCPDLLSVKCGQTAERSARTAELLARREALAHDLETRIADGRRASRELRDQWSELDRLVRQRQQELTSLRDQLRAVDTALAETDARLRYRRLETSIDQRWSAESTDWEPQLAELDQQITRSRAALADLDHRQSRVRGRIAQVTPGDTVAATPVDGQAWLAIARQLATDLTGEVSRLARASTSQQCVCSDAHPRLRPIVETLSRQLDVLEALLDRQQRAAETAELEQEAELVERSQVELRRQLEHQLDRRQRLARSARPSRRSAALAAVSHDRPDDGGRFTAADAEQLELRRSELEHQRYGLCGRLADLEPQLDELCQQRDAVDRQRATLLSARAIDQVQRDLAAVERDLEAATHGPAVHRTTPAIADGLGHVSDFLAQLTHGELVRAELSADGGTAEVVNRAGEKVACSSLSAARHDQLYLSLCLALVSGFEGRGVRLPLVLDEPFLRLDQHDTAALAAVLDDFGRCGCQVLVFTSQRAAADRFNALGARVRDMRSLRAERSAA